MGEPLNFVPGDERLFKKYLMGLFVILCMRGRAASHYGWWWITFFNEGSWVLARAQKSHDVTRMSQACKISSKSSHITQCPCYSPITGQFFHHDQPVHNNIRNRHWSRPRGHPLGPTKSRIHNRPPVSQQAYLLRVLTAPQGSMYFNAIYGKHGKKAFRTHPSPPLAAPLKTGLKLLSRARISPLH